MASATKISYHKRLFLQLIVFSWAMVLCFIGFQYIREKEYKLEFLNAQLQQYNKHLLTTVEEGGEFEDYIDTHDKPFDELRISIITLSGAVVYDNTISLDSLDNHRNTCHQQNRKEHILYWLHREDGYLPKRSMRVPAICQNKLCL